MTISYKLLEEGYWLLTGEHEERERGITMFVHPETLIAIDDQLYRKQFAGRARWTNPQTGRPALMFNSGFIEKRRWMRRGWMMFNRFGRTLGEIRIERD